MTTTTMLEQPPTVLERPVAVALSLTWEKVLYAALLLAAFVTRFYDLGARVMSHDESLHTQFAWYLYQGRGFQHSPLMHGVLRFEVTAFFYWLFGDNDFTSRIPTALMGVAAVGLMWYYRRWLGRTGALVAAALLLISPYMLYYSRYIRDEPYVVVWGLLLALIVIRYMETRAVKYLYWLSGVSALFYATMEVSYIYIAISMLFLGFHLVAQLFTADWTRPELKRPFQIAFVALIVAMLVIGAVMAFAPDAAASGAATAQPADPAAAAPTPGQTLLPTQGITLGLAAVAAVALLAGAYFALRSFGRDIRRFPAFDLLMVLGLFVLPQLTAFPVIALGRDPLNYTPPATAGMNALQAFQAFLLSDGGVTLLICGLLIAATIVLGYLWDWRTFLICAGIFYAIMVTLFTTFFTNGGGLASGIIGSLAYWLEQHPVQRGGQPLYYYVVVNLPLYEFLPTIGALFAAYLGLRYWLSKERTVAPAPAPVSLTEPQLAALEDDQPGNGREASDDPDLETSTVAPPIDRSLLPFPVLLYFGFWAIGALAAFSIAGEKMPWLTTHITLPLILLSGWSIGQYIDGTDWGRMRAERGWLVALLLPVTVIALAAALGTFLGANPPFQGSELNQLQATGAFISSALVAAIGLAAILKLGQPLGYDNVARLGVLSFFFLLALLTARAAFVASYINYDYANEYLVYAHGARGVKTVMAQIEDISERTEDGLGIKVAYGSPEAWPMTWYFRNYYNQAYYGESPTREQLDAPVVVAGPSNWSKVEALLGSRYYQFEYIRMVWPMQDYFNLTWERVSSALTDPAMRQALWDIWYARDYTKYGEITGTNYELSEWPISERMRLYVRKDVAAMIWDYGVGPTALEPGEALEDPYADGRQTLTADRVWGSDGTTPGQFQSPRALAVGPDGSVFVADSRNHRIQKFDAEGNLVWSTGTFGTVDTNTALPGQFNEPWGVGVGLDGSIYVADTWNHRVQKLDANGQPVLAWGRFGQGESIDAFWGPRSVVVDGSGRVYVADTGNKRVAVFDEQGNPLSTIGLPGSDPGQLDEPVGLAVSPEGTLYVADTWNLRVQVFEPVSGSDDFVFVREWPIVGWYGTSVENKPYLALDSRGRVYVSDPEGYRVLVFDSAGQFLTTWGDFGSDNSTFALVSGIAVGPDGTVYVSDAGNSRILRFSALP